MRSTSPKRLNHVAERAELYRGRLHIASTEHHYAHKVEGEATEPAESEGSDGFGAGEWIAVEAGDEVDG